MIEFVDTLPEVYVQPAEYQRLLGLPAGFVLTDRMLELADAARAWYAQHGRPWLYARGCDRAQIAGEEVRLDGVAFHSPPLRKMFDVAAADRAVLAAVSAGPELEQQAQSLWHSEKPDEYFFLEMYGSAVVEHLIALTGARLCAWAETHAAAVLPHYSPGYPEWDIAEQSQLLDLICRSRSSSLPTSIEVLVSGMLRPKKSLLAVFGLTENIELARPLTGKALCENCSYLSCQYRRAPYQRTVEGSAGSARVVADSASQNPLPLGEGRVRANAPSSLPSPQPAPEEGASFRSPNYSINVKALRRWAEQRLQLTRHHDGTIEAHFRYSGTTCTNLGRPTRLRLSRGPRPPRRRLPHPRATLQPSPGRHRSPVHVPLHE